MSQSEVAQKCSMDINTVSRIELGKTVPSLRTLINLVNAIKSTDGYSSDEQIFLQIEK